MLSNSAGNWTAYYVHPKLSWNFLRVYGIYGVYPFGTRLMTNMEHILSLQPVFFEVYVKNWICMLQCSTKNFPLQVRGRGWEDVAFNVFLAVDLTLFLQSPAATPKMFPFSILMSLSSGLMNKIIIYSLLNDMKWKNIPSISIFELSKKIHLYKKIHPVCLRWQSPIRGSKLKKKNSKLFL